MISDLAFDISLLSVFSDNSTSLFGYDYSVSPPAPFYSFYLSRGNETTHIDFSKWYFPPSLS